MCSVALVTSTFTYQKSLQKYTHLTLEQRYQISSDLKSNISISEIARRLGCHKSIISREINAIQDYVVIDRNKLKAKLAHKANNTYRISDFAWAYIKHLLKSILFPRTNQWQTQSTRLD